MLVNDFVILHLRDWEKGKKKEKRSAEKPAKLTIWINEINVFLYIF